LSVVGKHIVTGIIPSNHDVPYSISIVLQLYGMPDRSRHHRHRTTRLSCTRLVEKQAERLPQICRWV